MRDKFKLLIHESTGQKYEDLFVKVMGYATPSFQPVKAHGNIGDRGNDGWCANGGIYYQVYAPEDLPSNNESSINKMKADFDKLASYWNKISPVQEYYFVVNDKYKGVSPHIYNAISDLKSKHNLKNAGVMLAMDLENLLFRQAQDVISSVVGTSNHTEQKKIYEYIIEELTRRMYLQHWPSISENLIANAIEDFVIEGFSDATMLIFRTVLPNSIPSFDSSIQDLANHTEALTSHFTKSEFASLSEDQKWWRRDMSWKREWIDDQDEYHRKYELYDNWRKNLYTLHGNLVHALNVFSNQVRTHVNPNYFMGQQFTIVDSMGTYNGLAGYEAIPNGYSKIN
ncbi:TPA: hypothetical protein QD004_001364 [Shewanella algae]|uniref:hypothetical protein n=2 Tax=Shewanella algae TaxID=38313 RepID=UPI001C56999A|nr:hypothetical protein [Shewanella algae]HDS1202086.1 hypothetical protein [Shewanella algae]